jgi:hypothetical protein
MNKAGFLFLSAVMSVGTLGLVMAGCGGDDTTTGGTGAGGSGTGGASASASASGSGSGSSGSAGGVKATCDTYCTDNVANCAAPNGQYIDKAACLKACASFAQGNLGDMAGNSLECRAYHTGAAKTAAAMHCPHSGITGGDLDPTATGASPADGPCGDGVAAFCKLAIATCAGADAVWASEALCVTDMKTLAKETAGFTTETKTGNTFNCRVYHLEASTPGGMAATTHCPHLKLVSDQCK